MDFYPSSIMMLLRSSPYAPRECVGPLPLQPFPIGKAVGPLTPDDLRGTASGPFLKRINSLLLQNRSGESYDRLITLLVLFDVALLSFYRAALRFARFASSPFFPPFSSRRGY